MATLTFEAYVGAGPAWTDIGANTLVFTGTGGIGNNIQVSSFQDETHLGSGDPGTDQCGANHCNNNKYLTGSTIGINGGGSETLNDTNLTANECTLRVHFNHGSSVSLSSARAYIFKPSVSETTEADNLIAYGFEQGVGNTAWVKMNDSAVTYGGDNSGERLDLAAKGPGTDLYFYLALSVSPQAVASFTDVDLGVRFVYA